MKEEEERFRARMTKFEVEKERRDKKMEPTWVHQFKDKVKAFNRANRVKIPESQGNRGGYDYFTQPSFVDKISKNLGYRIRDYDSAKKRRQDSMLLKMSNDWQKCENKLNETKDRVRDIRGKLTAIENITKWDQSSINQAELAQFGIRMPQTAANKKKNALSKLEMEKQEEEFNAFIE